MPTGIYKRTKENNGCFKKGHKGYWLGKKRGSPSEETKAIMRASHHKDQIPWIKGKKHRYDKRDFSIRNLEKAEIAMSDLIDRYSIVYNNIDFETGARVEAMSILDRKTRKKYNFTKEFILDQWIIPWVENRKKVEGGAGSCQNLK